MQKLDIAQHSTSQPETSIEYVIGGSAKLVADDTAKDIDLLGNTLTELKDRAGHLDQEFVAQDSVHDGHQLFDQAADLLTDAGADTGIHYEAVVSSAHEPAVAMPPDMSALGSIMDVMLEYQKLMNKESSDDHKTAQSDQTTALGVKDAQIDHEITKIGEMQHEAGERYDAAMDSADKELWTGVASGSMHIGENGTSSLAAELAKPDLEIKEIIAEIDKQQQTEDDTKDSFESQRANQSALDKNIEHAADQYEQILDSIGGQNSGASSETADHGGTTLPHNAVDNEVKVGDSTVVSDIGQMYDQMEGSIEIAFSKLNQESQKDKDWLADQIAQLDVEHLKLPVDQPTMSSGSSHADAGTHDHAAVSAGDVSTYPDLGHLGDVDVMALAFIVMMEATKSAQEDLKSIMDGVKLINAEKHDALLTQPAASSDHDNDNPPPHYELAMTSDVSHHWPF